MTQATQHFSTIARVIVPVADQERALGFYVGTLGFQKVADIPYGDDDRWIEVATPTGDTTIALAAPMGGPVGVMTGISFSTADVDAAYAALRDAGTDVDAEIMRVAPPVPPMFFFRDPDGNTLHVTQAA